MKILLTGASGQLGSEVEKKLKQNDFIVLAPRHNELDITSEINVSTYFKTNNPDAVIHCAAWTAVDLAESNKEKCMAVNVNGTQHLVDECIKFDIPILYISSDYVFDGSGKKPWKVNDTTSPIGIYGHSKEMGETIVRKHYKHFIMRISWVFGINGNNFIKTMLKLSKSLDTIKVVSDQIGSPTYVCDLAPLICEMIITEKYGTYHAHNSGYCSWFDVAVETFKVANIDIDVIPISSAEYPTPAKRPLNSRLDDSKLIENGFWLLPDWKDAVSRFVHILINN